MKRIIIVAVALISNSWVMASQELIDRLEAIHHEVECFQFAVDTDLTNDSMKDLSNRYMLFLASQAIGREFEDQRALANWSGRYVQDGFRDRLMGSLIAKSFRCPTDRDEILSIQIQQFKTLDKTVARQRIIDDIYAFLAERLKAARILSRGVVELDLVFQSDGSIDPQYVHVDEDARAVEHEISKAFYDVGPLKKIIWYEAQHLSVPDPYRLRVRVGR
jgi:hypothetical protein